MSLRLSVEFTLSDASSGATSTYPELAPFYVLAQLSQHVTSYYHSELVPVVDGRRASFSVTAPLDRRLPLSPSAHLALTFVATTHAPDGDARPYLLPLGELCLPLESSSFERLAFVDPCSRRHSSRRSDGRLVNKAYALNGVVTLHGSSVITQRATLLTARREQEALMTSYRLAYTRFVQLEHRPVLEYLRWMHMPEYVTREDRRVPAWMLLLRRPSRALEDGERARPAFFQSLLESALRIMSITTEQPLSQRQLMDAIDRLLAHKQPYAEDLTKNAAEALRLCALVGTVIGLALSLYATHTVYAVDHTNHAVHGGDDDRRPRSSRRRRQQAGGERSAPPIEVVERVLDIQEFKGADCEEKAGHIYMLAQLLREATEAWSRGFPLVARVARYLRTLYVPALMQVTAMSERASTTPAAESDSNEHTMAVLLPWWLLRDTLGESVTRHSAAAELSSDQRQVTARAPPLWLEGTALTWPLLAPLEAYGSSSSFSAENSTAVQRQRLDARTHWLAREIKALRELETLIDTTDHAGTRNEYLTSQRRLSNFYGRPTHLWIEDVDSSTQLPWDYLITHPDGASYGVKAPHLILGDTRAFTLTPLPRGGGGAMPAAHASAQDALAIYIRDSLLGETAIAPLAPPASSSLPPSWAQLASERPATLEAEQWRACFFVAIRSMELDEPPFSVPSLLRELTTRGLYLRLERLRVTASCEWVMLVISGRGVEF